MKINPRNIPRLPWKRFAGKKLSVTAAFPLHCQGESIGVPVIFNLSITPQKINIVQSVISSSSYPWSKRTEIKLMPVQCLSYWPESGKITTEKKEYFPLFGTPLDTLRIGPHGIAVVDHVKRISRKFTVKSYFPKNSDYSSGVNMLTGFIENFTDPILPSTEIKNRELLEFLRQIISSLRRHSKA